MFGYFAFSYDHQDQEKLVGVVFVLTYFPPFLVEFSQNKLHIPFGSLTFCALTNFHHFIYEHRLDCFMKERRKQIA